MGFQVELILKEELRLAMVLERVPGLEGGGFGRGGGGEAGWDVLNPYTLPLKKKYNFFYKIRIFFLNFIHRNTTLTRYLHTNPSPPLFIPHN